VFGAKTSCCELASFAASTAEAAAGPFAALGTRGAAHVFEPSQLWCPSCLEAAKNPGAGVMLQAQLWFRDPLNTSNQSTSLSDVVEAFVGP
jgi:hypothetical protein